MSKISDLIAKLCPNRVEYKPLGEIFSLRNGYTPSKGNQSYWAGGSIPWFRMEDIRISGSILSDSILHVTEDAVKGELFPANSIVVATSATIGVHALIEVPCLTNQRFTVLIPKHEYSKLYLPKFLFYYCDLLDKWCINNVNMSSFASVDMVKFRQFPMPIVPMGVQREVVEVLDKFALLTAELEKRKKQYEHYRDKLLEFTPPSQK